MKNCQIELKKKSQPLLAISIINKDKSQRQKRDLIYQCDIQLPKKKL